MEAFFLLRCGVCAVLLSVVCCMYVFNITISLPLLPSAPVGVVQGSCVSKAQHAYIYVCLTVAASTSIHAIAPTYRQNMYM